MAPPKTGAVNDVLEKFRQGQIKAAKVTANAAKEREERIKKLQGGGVKKPTTAKPTKSRAKSTTSSGPAGSDAPSGTGAGGAVDWKTHVPNKSVLPLGMRQKQVIDFLRTHEGPATVADIAASTERNIEQEEDLARALGANPKVAVDESAGTYSYQPDANVRDRDQLLEYVQRAGAPVAFSEIADAYKTVLNDVAALKSEGLIMGMHSYDPEVGCEVLYSVDAKLAGLAADQEVAALWTATELPDDDDEVAAELLKAGMQPVPRKAPRKRAANERKRKARKASRLRAVTNVHLMHLLEGEAPNAIDTLQ